VTTASVDGIKFGEEMVPMRGNQSFFFWIKDGQPTETNCSTIIIVNVDIIYLEKVIIYYMLQESYRFLQKK